MFKYYLPGCKMSCHILMKPTRAVKLNILGTKEAVQVNALNEVNIKISIELPTEEALT